MQVYMGSEEAMMACHGIAGVSGDPIRCFPCTLVGLVPLSLDIEMEIKMEMCRYKFL